MELNFRKTIKKTFRGQPAASECTLINDCYNIASRATQSNSVHVSVLKISIVHAHADGVSKSLSQNFFFAQAALVSAGKNIIFRYNNGYKQRLGPLVAKRRQRFSHGLEFLNEAEKEKNNGKGNSASGPS